MGSISPPRPSLEKLKRCSRCRVEKPPEGFYNRRANYCIDCARAAAREYRRNRRGGNACKCGCGGRTSHSVSEYIKGHRPGKPLEDRWEIAEAGHETPCWLWTGSIFQRSGYGQHIDGPAHRVVWERLRGPIAEGLQLHHRCPNRHCVNPDHLESKTPGGHVRLHRATLTPDQVRGIRAGGRATDELAERLGVTKGTLYDVLKRRSWKDI